MSIKTTSKTSNKLYKIKTEALASSVKSTGVKNEGDMLLLCAPKETDSVFTELHIPSKKDFVNAEMRDTVLLTKYEKEYDGYEAFKGSSIKEICNKYHLQIMTAENIKGYLADDGAAAINTFVKKFKETQKVSLITSCFYILAPRECFTNEYKGRELNTFIIFFRKHYHETEYGKVVEKDTLLQLYSSGNDFSEWRTLRKYVSGDSFSSDNFPKFFSNALFSLLLVISIVFGIYAQFAACAGFFLLYVILLVIFNHPVNMPVNDYWNRNKKDHS